MGVNLLLLRGVLSDAIDEIVKSKYMIPDLEDMQIEVMNIAHDMLRLRLRIDVLRDILKQREEGKNALPKTI